MWLERTEHYLKPVLNLYWRFRLVGGEHIPRRGPAILAPNHACFLDPWFVSINSHRHVSWLITRDWYDKSRFWNLFFRAHGTLPVESRASDTIRVVSDRLAEGRIIGVFPEGKISYDGKLQPFLSGISSMAAFSGAPVIPVGIQGAYECLPRQKRFPRPGPVIIQLGEPRVFRDAPWTSAPPKQALREFRDELCVEIRRLAGQETADATVDGSLALEEQASRARVE